MMARKIIQISDELQEWRELAEMYGELSSEAFEHQDENTKSIAWKLASTISKTLVMPSEATREDSDRSVPAISIFIAMEILKDLALFDIKVNTYSFVPDICVTCGGEAHA